jgi:TolA-binding protein
MIHDNLNNQWLLADLSNNKYQFYHKIRENEYDNISNKSVKKLNIYPTVGLIFFVLLLTLAFFKIQSSNSNSDLFSKYYSSENIADITRSNEANFAIIEFNEKEYEEASVLFSQIIKKDSSNIAIYFYNGICLIELNKLDDAIKTFQYIIKYKDTLYVEHAEWYLGLCYLKNNQIDLAKKQFTLIVNEEDNYHKKNAIKLLKQLQ